METTAKSSVLLFTASVEEIPVGQRDNLWRNGVGCLRKAPKFGLRHQTVGFKGVERGFPSRGTEQEETSSYGNDPVGKKYFSRAIGVDYKLQKRSCSDKQTFWPPAEVEGPPEQDPC